MRLQELPSQERTRAPEILKTNHVRETVRIPRRSPTLLLLRRVDSGVGFNAANGLVALFHSHAGNLHGLNVRHSPHCTASPTSPIDAHRNEDRDASDAAQQCWPFCHRELSRHDDATLRNRFWRCALRYDEFRPPQCRIFDWVS